MRAHGHYFRSRAAHYIMAEASLSADNKSLSIVDAQGQKLAEFPLKQIRASDRLGGLTRKLYLPEGGCFETRDNDAIDLILRSSRRNPAAGFLHRLEMSWKMVAFSVIAAIGVVVFMTRIGVPWMALQMAKETPPVVARIVSDQTMSTFDEIKALRPTKLTPQRVTQLQARLAHIAKFMPPAPGGYRLLLRDAPGLGPNAFALPDGRIVMTDQLVALSMSDDELEGVMGHEISHVVHAHGLQRAYQASLIPVILTFVSGDVSQLSHTATVLPGLLLQSSYSKDFEQQADDDGAAAMRRAGMNPAHMADILERIEHKVCGKKGCGPNWLGDHPDTAMRAARLRGN